MKTISDKTAQAASALSKSLEAFLLAMKKYDEATTAAQERATADERFDTSRTLYRKTIAFVKAWDKENK